MPIQFNLTYNNKKSNSSILNAQPYVNFKMVTGLYNQKHSVNLSRIICLAHHTHTHKKKKKRLVSFTAGSCSRLLCSPRLTFSIVLCSSASFVFCRWFVFWSVQVIYLHALGFRATLTHSPNTPPPPSLQPQEIWNGSPITLAEPNKAVNKLIWCVSMLPSTLKWEMNTNVFPIHHSVNVILYVFVLT